jgi:hypothetical protein
MLGSRSEQRVIRYQSILCSEKGIADIRGEEYGHSISDKRGLESEQGISDKRGLESEEGISGKKIKKIMI